MTTLVTVTQRVDTIVKALRRKPLKRFTTVELSAATGIDPTVLTSNMKMWMTKNIGDMAHVYLESHKGHALWYYDPDNERTEPPTNVRKVHGRRKTALVNTNGRGKVVVKRQAKHARSTHNGHLLAKVAFDEGGMVVAVTEDGRVIKGRWMS